MRDRQTKNGSELVQLSRRAFLASATALWGAPAPSAIQVGCQANAWPLKVGDFAQLMGVLGEMKALGYVGFECNIRFVQNRFGRAGEARREIDKTGVKFIGAHTSMQQVKPETFPDALKSVVAMGAERIILSGSGLAPNGKFEMEALRKKAARLDELGKICQQNGIRMAYHNHNPEFANGNAEIEGLAKNTNAELVDFLMDAGHGYLGGGNPTEFMLRHSSRIFGCHVKTFRGKDQQVPLGQGDFGFENLAAAIKKTGWLGWLITEEGGNPKYGNVAAVGPDRDYIRKIFGV